MPTPPSSVSLNPLPKWTEWRALLEGSDPAVYDAGKEGELLVARVRVLLIAVILFVPIVSLFGAHTVAVRENVTAFVCSLAGLVASAVLLRLARGDERRPRLPLLTSQFDVALISLAQFGYLLQGFPSAAVNSRTTFVAYFVAIGATCLRWDVRVTVLAGVAAMAQYIGIAIVAIVRWPDVPTNDTLIHGEMVFGHQIGRLIFLAAFTLLCAAIVRQSLALRISSTHDALTGLLNRGFFEERLADEVARARRTAQPLCVALVDVDHFKAVNDVHGHDAGDAALQVVATVLRRSLRRSDIVARWGGEEFALVLPETRPAEAFGKLEQLRVEIESNAILLSNGAEVRLTVSAGLATFETDGADARTLMSAADARLLEAKRSGRNRVSMSPVARGPSGQWRVVVAGR